MDINVPVPKIDIETGTQVNSTNMTNYYTKNEVDDFLVDKVTVEDGKGLSTNDYTDEDKQLVNEVQDAVDSINDKVNRSELPRKLSDLTDDLGTNPIHTHSQYLSAIPSEYVTETKLNNAIAYKADISDIPVNLSELVDDLGNNPVHTHSQYLTSIPSEYVTETEMNMALSSKANTSAIPNKVSDLTNDTGFITKAINDLTNYYLKSEVYAKGETYTKTEVNSLVSEIPKFKIEVVQSLPVSNISNTTIYLVLSQNQNENLYDEYIYVNNNWEKLGSQNVDLTNYALKSELPSKLSDLTDDLGNTPTHTHNQYLTAIPNEYITETELTTAISSKANASDIPTKVSDLTNDSGFLNQLTILSYGSSTWNDFITAYRKNAVIYCKASSNSDPSSGNQGRLAFLAYVNNPTNPTSVEFQYYRSVSSHTADQQGDQVFVYQLTSAGVWSVITREASSKIVVGSGLSSSYANGAITLSADISGKEDAINKVISITSTSTNTQYPSAKAVYDLFTSITDAEEVHY